MLSGMFEAHYTPRAPRVQVAGGAVRRRLALRSAPSGDDQVLDLSSDGMKLLAAQPLTPGDVLDVELMHPALRGALALSASVQWARPSSAAPDRVEAGLRFDCMRDTTRVALEQVIAAELGSQVVSPGTGHVGWIAKAGSIQRTDADYFVYDREQREVATFIEVEGAFRVTRRQTPYDPREFETLAGALGWALDQRSERLQVIPALPSSGGSSHGAGRP
jgi:hypothetical protein